MKKIIYKIISLILCINIIISINIVSYAYVSSKTDKVVDSGVCYLYGKNSDVFCKIKKETSLIAFKPFDKVNLYVDYYVDEDCEFMWNIEGKSRFIDGETKKLAKGNNVKVLFIDDSTVNLKLVSSDGKVLAEDEMLLKKYVDKDVPVFTRFIANILMSIMIVIGVIGGTFGIIETNI